MDREQKIKETVEQAKRIYQMPDVNLHDPDWLAKELRTLTDEQLDAEYNQIIQDVKAVSKLRLSGIKLKLVLDDNKNKDDGFLVWLNGIEPVEKTFGSQGLTFNCGAINKGKLYVGTILTILGMHNPYNITLDLSGLDLSVYDDFLLRSLIDGLCNGNTPVSDESLSIVASRFKKVMEEPHKNGSTLSTFSSDTQENFLALHSLLDAKRRNITTKKVINNLATANNKLNKLYKVSMVNLDDSTSEEECKVDKAMISLCSDIVSFVMDKPFEDSNTDEVKVSTRKSKTQLTPLDNQRLYQLSVITSKIDALINWFSKYIQK